MKKNFKYQEGLKENTRLKERLREAEKELDDIIYKALELEHLQILSVKQKEQDADERKKLGDQIERAQEDLEDQVEIKKNQNF